MIAPSRAYRRHVSVAARPPTRSSFTRTGANVTGLEVSTNIVAKRINIATGLVGVWAIVAAVMFIVLFDEFNGKNLSDSLVEASQLDLLAYATFAPPESADGAPNVIIGPVALPDPGAATPLPHSDSAAGPTQAAHLPTIANATPPASVNPRPYFGDAFYSFQQVYWPIHCVICLAICTMGIFANVTNIIVLTRSNMITAVNTILSAMAFSDLIVNISNIPYLMHELSDSTNFTTFYSFQWALYILFHAHTTVTAHTISIWLTCLLATWRYFVVCRSQSSNQRNFSVGLAKRTIVAVFLLVPIFCIPNYLSFAIVREETESNQTIYKVGFSHLADESQFIKTFHFWIFSCLTKLMPCVLLTFFTTVLIRKLLSARERRLRLASYGTGVCKEQVPMDACRPSGGSQRASANKGVKMVASAQRKSGSELVIINQTTSDLEGGTGGDDGGLLFKPLDMDNGGNNIMMNKVASSTSANELNDSHQLRLINGNSTSEGSKSTRDKLQLNSGSSLGGGCATDAELIATSSSGSDNGRHPMASTSSSNSSIDGKLGPPKPRSRLMVESIANHQTVSTSTIPTSPVGGGDRGDGCTAADRYLPSGGDSCDNSGHLIVGAALIDQSNNKPAGNSNRASIIRKGRGSLVLGNSTGCLSSNGAVVLSNQDKRASGSATALTATRGRSVGSTTLAPMQIVKIQATQRQLSQNETTTRLLIAVMIVFLICEFPAGILAALCAVLGQDFFENVYQPTGILTDLLALINSSVNFILYCFMSTQFRITFYRVVLHCPAPHGGVSEK